MCADMEKTTYSVSTRTKWKRGKKLAKKVYVVRIISFDEDGKRREKSKEFLYKQDANDYLLQQKIANHKTSSPPELTSRTFNDLADFYVQTFAFPARYSGDTKIAGLRSLKPVQGYINTLRAEFGARKLTTLTYGDMRNFAQKRHQTPVIITQKVRIPIPLEERTSRKRTRIEYVATSSPRSVASVNRELMTLRRMLNVAVSEGWIDKNPMKNGQPLINMSREVSRNRILSSEEEQRLLVVCDCDERRHLYGLIVCLLDTGLRVNEALTLKWDDVDQVNGLIHVKASNTKTARPKTIPISARFQTELQRLREQGVHVDPRRSEPTHLNSVFGVRNIKRSWTTARRLAGLNDIRLHDLRHTFGTRLDRSGFTQAQIARMLGHQQVHTTYRYTNPDRELLEDVRAAIDSRKTLESHSFAIKNELNSDDKKI